MDGIKNFLDNIHDAPYISQGLGNSGQESGKPLLSGHKGILQGGKRA